MNTEILAVAVFVAANVIAFVAAVRLVRWAGAR